MLDINERVELYCDYLDNGGIQKIRFLELLVDLKKVMKMSDGSVDIQTISPTVNAAMLAYEATQMTAPIPSDRHLSEYETLYQKSCVFKQTNIDTEEQFMQLLEQFRGKDNILFRGLHEAKYCLYSSLQRFWITQGYHQKDINYGDFIKTLINNAKESHQGVLRNYLDKTGLSHENDIAILSFLQHYGCPTPLLDWTYSFDIALYFATQNIRPASGKQINNYFCVYYLEEEYLKGSSLSDIVKQGLTSVDQIKEKMRDNVFEEFKGNGFTDDQIKAICTDSFIEQLILTEYGPGTLNFMSKIDNLLKHPISYFSDLQNDPGLRYSLQNNMNIVNQKGVFTWNSKAIEPLEYVANEEYGSDENDVTYLFSKCVNINKSLVPFIKKTLKRAGITKRFVFPDPYRIAKDTLKRTVSKK